MPLNKAGSYIRVEEKRTVTGEVRLGLVRAVLEEKKPIRFTAGGFSMSPIIRDQDILTIEPLPYGRPVPGDVVAFEVPATQTLIVHRVIQRDDNGVLVKGDNAYEPDGMVPAAGILGIVTRVERNGRSVPAGLGRGRGLIAFLSRHGILKMMFRFIRLPFIIAKAGQRKIKALAGGVMRKPGSVVKNPPSP